MGWFVDLDFYGSPLIGMWFEIASRLGGKSLGVSYCIENEEIS
ncbi:hypothetical protein SAMN05216315_11415 [Nitrosospira sp. Nsp18]|nr:hypothetical protein SAMN05216315_11415 [Nitrosospira sp. Nsp18]